MRHCVDLTGQSFGRWTVIGPAPHINGKPAWACRCGCGHIKDVRANSLRTGRSQSCGCIRNERTSKALTIHGATKSGGKKTRAYEAWVGMKERCYNPNRKNYRDYGGRGIVVCDRWRKNFVAFWNDLGDPPDGLSLERINNDGNYEPKNCRWATRAEQSANRRCSIYIDLRGRRLSAAEWAAETGLSQNIIRKRIMRGWLPMDAVSTPANKKNPRVDCGAINGVLGLGA